MRAVAAVGMKARKSLFSLTGDAHDSLSNSLDGGENAISFGVVGATADRGEIVRASLVDPEVRWRRRLSKPASPLIVPRSHPAPPFKRCCCLYRSVPGAHLRHPAPPGSALP